MSYDAAILKFEGAVPPWTDESWEWLEENAPPNASGLVPLGSPADVNRAIAAVFPAYQWEEGEGGTLADEHSAVAFDFERRDGRVAHIHLTAHGQQSPVPAIARLCREAGWVALDMQTGDYIDLTHPSDAGWNMYTGSRDHVKSMLIDQALSTPQAEQARKKAMWAAAIAYVALIGANWLWFHVTGLVLFIAALVAWVGLRELFTYVFLTLAVKRPAG